MHMVWKRPDGFLGASPDDFRVVNIAGDWKIWLHKQDNVHFPFRVSGGWQDENASSRINALANLLDASTDDLISHLLEDYYESSSRNESHYIKELSLWLRELSLNLKGDKWETTIMQEVLTEIGRKLESVRKRFTEEAAKAPTE